MSHLVETCSPVHRVIDVPAADLIFYASLSLSLFYRQDTHTDTLIHTIFPPHFFSASPPSYPSLLFLFLDTLSLNHPLSTVMTYNGISPQYFNTYNMNPDESNTYNMTNMYNLKYNQTCERHSCITTFL